MCAKHSNRKISKTCRKHVDSRLRAAAKAGITLHIDEVIEQFYVK